MTLPRLISASLLALGLLACGRGAPQLALTPAGDVVLTNLSDETLHWQGPDHARRFVVTEALVDGAWLEVTPYVPWNTGCVDGLWEPRSLEPGGRTELPRPPGSALSWADTVSGVMRGEATTTFRLRLLGSNVASRPYVGVLPSRLVATARMEHMEADAFSAEVARLVGEPAEAATLPRRVQRHAILTMVVEPALMADARRELVHAPDHPWFREFVQEAAQHLSDGELAAVAASGRAS